MSLLDYNAIPGYAEAVKVEQANRDLAYLKDCPPICGIPVRHMNARHWILLAGCGNKFITGGRPLVEDVTGFFWFLSPKYSVNTSDRDIFIAALVHHIVLMDAPAAIYAYLDRTFQDCPQGAGEGGKYYTAPVASTVDLLAREYGWTDEHILEMPLARLFQQLRRIEMRYDRKKPQFNRSEKLVSEWLARQGSN